MARERGLTVDVEGFNKLMEEQRARARAAQKKASHFDFPRSRPDTHRLRRLRQVGDARQSPRSRRLKDKTAVILDTSACYAEMGGQLGDTGELEHGGQSLADR